MGTEEKSSFEDLLSKKTVTDHVEEYGDFV